MGIPMVRSLHKSADIEEDLSITFEPMGGLWQERDHTVVYHAVMYCTKCVRGQKVPRVLGYKKCPGCQELKGTNGA